MKISVRIHECATCRTAVLLIEVFVLILDYDLLENLMASSLPWQSVSFLGLLLWALILHAAQIDIVGVFVFESP